MVYPRKEGLDHAEEAGGSDRGDRPLDEDVHDESRAIDGSSVHRGYRTSTSLTERLIDVLRDESDGDLLLERSDVENGVSQWLRALDSQVMGACRADERLKPMLTLNISNSIAEDRLITQLSQHFEASEVGMLARCLCVPLVSIRVGRVHKQGNLLCPTSARGYLNLTLLPTSNMRLSFAGDDGCSERLSIVGNDSENSAVIIEEILADTSGRSFLLKLPGSQVLYFWCSEKSKIQGMQLLSKMKDLLRRKPTLSCLTGISESRLTSFVNRLRACLYGPESAAKAASTSSESDSESRSMVSTSSRFRPAAAYTSKVHPLHQGSLSPRSNTFKDGLPRSSSAVKSGVREKIRRRGDTQPILSIIGSQQFLSATGSSKNCGSSSSDQFEDEKGSDSESCGLLPQCFSEMLTLSTPLSFSCPLSSDIPPSNSMFQNSQLSPYYCWCPPCISPLQYTLTSHLPTTALESLPLPPLSSLLTASGCPSSVLPSTVPITAAEIPKVNLPALFPEPLLRLPLPVSSIGLSGAQPIPTFTPLMSDPIVHIPVIDLCSSGHSYLVSAGPAISSAVPPLVPKIMSPLIPKSESLVEKSARETLRMLMASTPTSSSPLFVSALPAVISSVGEIYTFNHENKHDFFPAGSRGLYPGMNNVGALADDLASMRLSRSNGKDVQCGSGNASLMCYDTVAAFEGHSSTEEDAFFPREEEDNF